MRTTIKGALRKQSGENTKEWADQEAIPALTSMRATLNQVYSKKFTWTSSGSGILALAWEGEAFDEDAAIFIEAHVIGKGTGARYAMHVRWCFCTMVAGTLTVVSDVPLADVESTASMAVQFGSGGNYPILYVRDDGTPITYTLWINVYEGPGA